MDSLPALSASRSRRLRAAINKKRLWSDNSICGGDEHVQIMQMRDSLVSLTWMISQMHFCFFANSGYCSNERQSYAEHASYSCNVEQSDSSDHGRNDEIDSSCGDVSRTSPDNSVIQPCTPMPPDAEHSVNGDESDASSGVLSGASDELIGDFMNEVEAACDVLCVPNGLRPLVQGEREDIQVDCSAEIAFIFKFQQDTRSLHNLVMNDMKSFLDEEPHRVMMARSAALVGKSSKARTHDAFSVKAAIAVCEELNDSRETLRADISELISHSMAVRLQELSDEAQLETMTELVEKVRLQDVSQMSTPHNSERI